MNLEQMNQVDICLPVSQIRMTRHSKNCTASSVYSYHEKKKDAKSSGYGSLKLRYGKDGVKDFDCCSLSLHPCRNPVVTPGKLEISSDFKDVICIVTRACLWMCCYGCECLDMVELKMCQIKLGGGFLVLPVQLAA